MTVLNRFPMVVVCHNKTRRRWFERSKMIQPWWFPSKTIDRQTFAADMLFNGAAEENFPRKMPADAWFDFKGCDRSLVEEQSAPQRRGHDGAKVTRRSHRMKSARASPES
jgi:hypothetical protein